MSYIFKENMVSSSKYAIKCPNAMNPIGITIHNTDNDASAQNEIKYMISNSNQTSFHVAIDDKEVIQGIPFTRNAWHAGDGKSGTGNRKTIAIEICYSASGGTKFTEAEKNAAAYTAKLLKQYGWTVKNVYQHHDWSGKDCPHRTRQLGWSRFIKMIQNELDALNKGSTSSAKVTQPSSNKSYKVKITGASTLNVRAGAGTNFKITQVVKKGDVFTIVEEKTNGTTKWGKLKSGVGWISLKYTTKI